MQANLNNILKAVKKPLDDSDTAFVNLPLDRHLLNIHDFILNHKDVPGFDKVIANLKNTSINAQKGITHTLNVIKDYDPGTIKSFDLTFEGDGLPCAGCRFDVELADAKFAELRFIEFKSYALDSIPNIPLPQFKNYLASVNSISEFKYVFNKLDTPNVADIKTKFKQVFNKDPEGIFNTMSLDLKNELNIKDVDELIELVNDTSSELYDFIEVK